MKWWDVRLNFFSVITLLPLPQRNEYSLMPGREGNEISAPSLSLSVSLSISAFQKLMVWFIEPRRAVLLLSLKTFYLGLSSTYCIVWAKCKEFPPTVYHFNRPKTDLQLKKTYSDSCQCYFTQLKLRFF